jgi:ABC-type branched-subunit amino acid transport system ATPase component
VNTPLLAVRDLHVRLGESHILQGVSFDVPAGGITALLGRNGVGKTTTLRAILGLVDRRGSVQLDGVELTGMSTHRIVQRSGWTARRSSARRRTASSGAGSATSPRIATSSPS